MDREGRAAHIDAATRAQAFSAHAGHDPTDAWRPRREQRSQCTADVPGGSFVTAARADVGTTHRGRGRRRCRDGDVGEAFGAVEPSLRARAQLGSPRAFRGLSLLLLARRLQPLAHLVRLRVLTYF